MKILYAFCQDADGAYYICPSPVNVHKEHDQWKCSEGHNHWIRVFGTDDGQFTPRPSSLMNPLIKALDFSTIPVPKWEDESPVYITQTITIESQTYYTEE